MGTRSLTIIQDRDGSDIAVLYRQMDGYPSGHGNELARFLKSFTVVNGFSIGDKKGKVANGMACLAAQVVAKFKREVGGFYLHAAGTRDCGEEYRYTVSLKDRQLWLQCHGGYGDDWRLLYDGPAKGWKASLAETAEKMHAAAV